MPYILTRRASVTKKGYDKLEARIYTLEKEKLELEDKNESLKRANGNLEKEITQFRDKITKLEKELEKEI